MEILLAVSVFTFFAAFVAIFFSNFSHRHTEAMAFSAAMTQAQNVFDRALSGETPSSGNAVTVSQFSAAVKKISVALPGNKKMECLVRVP